MSKKILVINDIPGAGKVAANVNIPLLSAAGFETAILPTLILSKNTDYDQGEVVRYPMDEAFQAMMNHWDQAQLDFEVYTTGFFNSTQQIQDFAAYFKKRLQANPSSRLYIDPIMGDHGKLYPGFNADIPHMIGDLCQGAYLILPNLTEACLMTGYPYAESFTQADYIQLCQALKERGVQEVVLSGIEDTVEGQEKIGFFYYKDPDHYESFLHNKYPYPFFGTGDMAMSLIILCHEWGLSIKDSLEQAGQWIEQALEATIQLKRTYQEGVYFEPLALPIAQFAHRQAQKEADHD